MAAAIVAAALLSNATGVRVDAQGPFIDALVKMAPVPSAAMPSDPVGRFEAEIVNVAIPAAEALHVRFQPDGAQSLLDYIGTTGTIVEKLKTPSGRPAPAVIARNQQRFVALTLAHAEETSNGLVFTARSTERLKLTLRQAATGWCPCWPFC